MTDKTRMSFAHTPESTIFLVLSENRALDTYATRQPFEAFEQATGGHYYGVAPWVPCAGDAPSRRSRLISGSKSGIQAYQAAL